MIEKGFVCAVKFDDDLPNGPFAEGSAGTWGQPGSFSASVPATGATWGLVAKVVADHQNLEWDKLCEGGKMKYNGQWNVGHVMTSEAAGVMYKGGPAPPDGPAMEGSCTVQLKTTDVMTTNVQCCTIL